MLWHCLDETDDLTLQWLSAVQGSDPYRERGAPCNARRVERVVALARPFGREPTTLDEVREIRELDATKEGKQ